MGTLPPEYLLVAALVAFGLAAGLVVLVVRYIGGRSNRKRRFSQPPTAEEQAEIEPATPDTASPSGAYTAAQRESKELLRVERSGDGLVSVCICGLPYKHLRDISDPRLGRDAIEAIRAVLAFAEGWLPFIQKEAGASPSPKNVAPRPGSRPSRNDTPVLPSASKPAAAASSPAILEPGRMLTPLHFVDEINDLVQQRLKEQPDLTDHLITLTTGIGGGIRICVDQEIFEAVSDITDSQIRALIQGAIREWEGS